MCWRRLTFTGLLGGVLGQMLGDWRWAGRYGIEADFVALDDSQAMWRSHILSPSLNAATTSRHQRRRQQSSES
jgi:hypothetical protein